MAAVNFPSSPSNGDTLTSGNSVYTYNSTKTRWDAVTTVNGIQLSSLSVGAEGTASGDGALGYNNTSGEFSYTPPDLSTYLTSETDSQTLSLAGNTLSISGGNSADLSSLNTDSLPSQTGNSGEYLTTNGTTASWASVSGGGDSQKDFTSSGTVAAATPVILNAAGTVSEISVSAAAWSSSSDSIDVISSSTYEGNSILSYDYIWDSYNNQYIALNVAHTPHPSGAADIRKLYSQVVTVNTAANTMTAGSEQLLHNSIYAGGVIGSDLGGGKILICYRPVSGYVSAAVITNNGGTLTLGSVVSLKTITASYSQDKLLDLCTDPDTGTSYLLLAADAVNTNPSILSITVTGTTPALASSADLQTTSVNAYARNYGTNGSQSSRIFWNSTHSKLLVLDAVKAKSTICTVSGTTVTVATSIAFATGINMRGAAYQEYGFALEYHPYLDVYMFVMQNGLSTGIIQMAHATFDGTTFSFPTSISNAYTISGTGGTRVDNQIMTSSVNAGIAVVSCRGEYEYKASQGTYSTGSSSYTGVSNNQLPTPTIYNKTWYTRGAQDTSGNISYAGFYGGTDAQSKLKIAVARMAASSTKTSYIGMAQAAVADATAVTVMLPGGISTGHTGLTAKTTYYLADDGALTSTVTTVKAGVAIDATTLQVADTLGGLAVNLLSYATKASPALTGIPTAPTAGAAINSTQLATTAYVTTAVSATVSGVASVNSATGTVVIDTDDISEGSTNEYHTTARARAAISGTGSIGYNSSTGVISLASADPLTDTSWDATATSYTLEDSAYAVTLAWSGTNLVLGSGSWASTDVGKTIHVNGGKIILTATSGSYSVVSAISSTTTAASGAWSMYAVVYDATADALTPSNASVAYDFSTKTLSSTTTLALMKSFHYNYDGSKGYTIGGSNTMQQWSLSTAYDWSTRSIDTGVTNTTWLSGIGYGGEISVDGTAIWIMKDNHIYGKQMSTAWDLSTVGSGNQTYNFGAKSGVGNTRLIRRSLAGDKIYVSVISGTLAGRIRQYSLADYNNVPHVYHDLSDDNKELDHTNEFTNWCGSIDFNSSGTQFYLSDATTMTLYVYNLSTAWDISTASYASVSLVFSDAANMYTATMMPDGTKLWVNDTNNNLYEYSIASIVSATGYQVSTSNVDTTHWDNINSLTATDSETVYYAISADAKTTWNILDNSLGVRPIAKLDSGTWKYNSNTAHASETWTNATVNSQNQAIKDSMGVTANQMTKAEMNAITDAYHITLGTSLDLAVITHYTSGTLPTYSGTSTNYDPDNNDITGVNAGTGLIGGGTSGNITLALDTPAGQKFVANGAISAHDPVVINTDGTIESAGTNILGVTQTAANQGFQDHLPGGLSQAITYDTLNSQWVGFGGYNGLGYFGRFNASNEFNWDQGPFDIGGGARADNEFRQAYDSTIGRHLCIIHDTDDNRYELLQTTITTTTIAVHSAGWTAGMGAMDAAEVSANRVRGFYLTGTTSKVGYGGFDTSGYPTVQGAIGLANGGFTVDTPLTLASYSNAGDANTLSRFDTAYHANSGKAIAVYSTDATTIKSSTINFSGSTPVKSDEQTVGTNRSGVNPDGPQVQISITGNTALCTVMQSVTDGTDDMNVNAYGGVIDASTGEVTWASANEVLTSFTLANNPAYYMEATMQDCYSAIFYGDAVKTYRLVSFKVNSATGAVSILENKTITETSSVAGLSQNAWSSMTYDADQKKIMGHFGSTSTTGSLSGWNLRTYTDSPVITGSDVANRARYIGIAKAAIANTETGAIDVSGVHDGFSGLTIATEYYIQDDGTISATVSTTPIGIAVSATKLLLR